LRRYLPDVTGLDNTEIADHNRSTGMTTICPTATGH
jgi:hypothetical protein